MIDSVVDEKVVEIDGRENTLEFYSMLSTSIQDSYREFRDIPRLQHAVQEIVKDREYLEYEELKTLVQQGTRNSLNMNHAHGRARITKMFIHWCMLKFGFRDQGDTEYPVYVRKDDDYGSE